MEDKDFLRQIIYNNKERKAKLQKFYMEQGKKEGYKAPKLDKPKPFTIYKPIAQNINGTNLYSTLINGSLLIGLVFEKEDNPYDYEDVFLESLHEHLNNINPISLEKENEIENLLISVFIDLRRFSDEIINQKPQIEYDSEKVLIKKFFKVFLFGIDDSGKSSLIRRLKYNVFNHNYFTPSKDFNIEYVKHKKGVLAWWDMPGQKVYRGKWLLGSQDANIYVYLIDIANQRRFKEVKHEFWTFLKKRRLDKVPLLILGNKLDLINYLGEEEKNDTQLQVLRQEIFNFFEFEQIDDREWDFFFISVKTRYNIPKISKSIFRLIHL